MFWLDEICYVEDDFDSGCCHLGKFVPSLEMFFVNYKCRVYDDKTNSYFIISNKEALIEKIIGVERCADKEGFFLIPWNAEDRHLAEMLEPYNGYLSREIILDLRTNAPKFYPFPLDSQLKSAPRNIYFQINDFEAKRNDFYLSIANILNICLGLSKYDRLGFYISLINNEFITLQDIRTYSAWHSGDYKISKALLNLIISKKLQGKIEIKEVSGGVVSAMD